MAAPLSAGGGGTAVSFAEAATALRPLALTTLEKQNDPTYAIPQHYLYELAVHTRYCPLDTKFAVEPSTPGTGYGTVICLENNCFLEIKLQPSRWTTSADGGLSSGIGSLAPYTAHVQNASETHRAARDARVKAQQAEYARNGVPPGIPQPRPRNDCSGHPLLGEAAASRYPKCRPDPMAGIGPDGWPIHGGRDAHFRQGFKVDAPGNSASSSSSSAAGASSSQTGTSAVSTPLMKTGSGGASAGGSGQPSDIKPFQATHGPIFGAPLPYSSSDIKPKPGMMPSSFASSSSSPGPSTPALYNGLPVNGKHALLSRLTLTNGPIGGGIKRASSSHPPSSASSGSSSSSSKRRKGPNGSSMPLSSSTNDPTRDAELGRLGYAPPKQHPSQRKKRKSSQGGDGGDGGNSDDGSSASEGERLARERRAKRYENRMDGLNSGSEHEHDSYDSDESEQCRAYSSESDGYGGRRSAAMNRIAAGGRPRRRLIRAGGTPRAPVTAETIEEFTRRSLAGTGFENKTDIGKAREALGLQHPGDFIPGTNIDPYPYQCVGINWLLKKEKDVKGGLLADEMGLGKTCQMISLMALAPSKDGKRKTTLVVAPVALLTQWKEEIEEKTDEGTYEILIYHGTTKKGMKPKEILSYDIVITTYGVISAEWYDEKKDSARKDYGPLFDCRFYRIILDEAQLIRNPSSRYSRSVSELAARYKWCLTGTPLVNSLNDAFPYLRFIGVPKWGERDEFYPHITKIEKRNPDLASKRLAALLRGVMIRRTKKCQFDGKPIITLPTKHKEDIDIILSPEERDVYNSIEKGVQVEFKRYVRAGTVMKHYSNILTMLLWLRMCCDHPSLALQNGTLWEDEGEAAKRTAQECETARIINGAPWVEKVKKDRLGKAIKAIKDEQEDKDVEGDECPVCREPIGEGKITKCFHIFCQDCLTNLLTSAPAGDMLEEDDGSVRPCPCCRAPISGRNVFSLAAFEPSQDVLDLHRAVKKSPKKKKGKKPEPSPGSKSFATIVDISDSDEELPNLPSIKKETKLVVKEEKEKKPVVKAEVKEEDDEIQIIASSSAALRTPAKKVPKMSDKKKGKRPTKARRRRPESDSSDGLSDFIVDDDEDPYADRPSKKKNKGKQRASRSKSPAGSEADDTGLDSDSDDGKPFSPAKMRLPTTMTKFVPSAKFARMMKHIKDLFSDPQTKQDKIIIISQWTSALDLAGEYLRSEGYRFVEFDGRLDLEGKDAAAREFKKNKKTKIMLLSLKAGGVGLNLTVANHVINLDLAYNTAVEDQAFDRCHRIGQKKEVHVHRYIVKNSVEERILALQERKDALIDGAIGDKSIARSGRFSVEDFVNLFGLGRQQPAERVAPAIPLIQARLARMPARNAAAAPAGGAEGAANGDGNNVVANIANAALAGLGAFNGIQNL